MFRGLKHYPFIVEKKSCTCDKSPTTCSVHPIPQAQATPPKARLVQSESDEKRNSGAGILEFTPARAGMDVTPLNLDFKESPAASPKLSHSRLSRFTCTV